MFSNDNDDNDAKVLRFRSNRIYILYIFFFSFLIIILPIKKMEMYDCEMHFFVSTVENYRNICFDSWF